MKLRISHWVLWGQLAAVSLHNCELRCTQTQAPCYVFTQYYFPGSCTMEVKGYWVKAVPCDSILCSTDRHILLEKGMPPPPPPSPWHKHMSPWEVYK